MVLGEGAYLLPWIFAALIAAAVQSRHRKVSDDRSRFLLWLALPPILVFTITPLWGDARIAALDDARLVFPLPAVGRLARRAGARRR